jgi:hypothetical protein
VTRPGGSQQTLRRYRPSDDAHSTSLAFFGRDLSGSFADGPLEARNPGVATVPAHQVPTFRVFSPKIQHARRFGVRTETFYHSPRHTLRGSVAGHSLVTFGSLGSADHTSRPVASTFRIRGPRAGYVEKRMRGLVCRPPSPRSAGRTATRWSIVFSIQSRGLRSQETVARKSSPAYRLLSC